MDDKNIVYITDENYAMPTVVSIISLIVNNISESLYNIYILENGVSEYTKKILESFSSSNITCHVISVTQGKYKKLSENCLTEGIHVSDSALYKFDIANILEPLDMVLYLDSDIIINKDISKVFETDISDNYLASVDEMGDEIDTDGQSTLAARIGLSNVDYFNSGVMLLNLKRMRCEGVSQKLLKYRMTYPNYFMDQDAFNGVMYGKRVKLPCYYNFRTALFDVMLPEEIGVKFFGKKYLSVRDCLFDQIIIHMSSQFKPWKYNIPWVTEVFYKYYGMSPYKNEDLVLRSHLREIYVPLKNEAMRIARHNEWLTTQYEWLTTQYSSALEEKKRKIWGFPYSQIKQGSRVVLYGAGVAGKDLKKQIEETEYCNIILWVDRDYKKGEGIVNPPEAIKKVDFDYIIIAITKNIVVEEVKEYLRKLYIDSKKIITL